MIWRRKCMSNIVLSILVWNVLIMQQRLFVENYLFVIKAVWKLLAKFWYFRHTFGASTYFGSFWFVYKMHFCLNNIFCFLLLLLSKLDNTSGRNKYLTIEFTFLMQTFYSTQYNMTIVYIIETRIMRSTIRFVKM